MKKTAKPGRTPAIILPERIDQLSIKRQEIIRPILEHPREYVLLSVRAMAKRLRTDPATIVRIVRGLGFGGYWGLLGALLHMLNHALCKSMLFILSGNILLKYETADVRNVRGLLKAAPWTGALFLCGIFALIGMPPFGLFISEFLIFRAGFAAHFTPYAVTGIALLVLIFAGMLAAMNQMLYGEPGDVRRGDPVRWELSPLLINIVVLVGLGLTLPNAVREFFGHILKILGVMA